MTITNWMAPAFLGPIAHLLCVFLAALLLVGCVLAPNGSPGRPATMEALVRKAESARTSHDLARSALLYEQAADAARSPKQEALRLKAARLYVALDEPKHARSILEQTRGTALSPSGIALQRIVTAELALAASQGADALAALSSKPSNIPGQLEAAWLEVEADARLAKGQPLVAARLRERRSRLLQKPAQHQANRQALWSAMLAASMEELARRVPPTPDRFGGWIELAYFYRTRQLDPQALTTALHAWQERYPDHPANGTFLKALLTTAERSVQRPDTLALLLPLSGRLAAVGSAVEHGFMAAYYQDPPQQRPTVRLYDIGEAGLDSLSAYHDAVAAGADIVVGPLTKAALQQLTVLDFASTPILGLNTLPDPVTSAHGLYQFGLAPEDDAFAAADLAWQRGFRTAVMLIPNSKWGERVAHAFEKRFKSLGGRVLERVEYQRRESDFSDPIEAVFNLDISIRRYKELRGFLQREIHFHARRRQDADCIFIGAFPREARLIAPQIRFHNGMDVPVIATAQAYAGTTQPAANRDMDGLLLADIPWLMPNHDTASGDALSRDRLAQLWPENTQDLPRLYALGMDAYRLASVLTLLQSHSGLQLEGRTGRLTMDVNGVIHRDLQPAQFVDGRLQPLATQQTPLEQPTQGGKRDDQPAPAR